ncbi:hypothetical protein [Streptosporangium sp. NPDC049304]|uniref:hypothetical protein n=1 Tax=Streptosporangium sp. NPDC049304 TaxID=3154830 RepID=UPI00344AD4AC
MRLVAGAQVTDTHVLVAFVAAVVFVLFYMWWRDEKDDSWLAKRSERHNTRKPRYVEHAPGHRVLAEKSPSHHVLGARSEVVRAR